MPIRETKDGRLTWPPGQKPKVVMAWLIATVSHRAIGLPGARLAAVLADGFNDKTGACWKTNERMAGETGVSESAIKAGLQELEAAGCIIRVKDVIGRKQMRVIYPRKPTGADEPLLPRAARGGVPPGTDPKNRKAEKAAAASGTAAFVATSKAQEPCAPQSSALAPDRVPVFEEDVPGSWANITAIAAARVAAGSGWGTDLRAPAVTVLATPDGTEPRAERAAAARSGQGSAGRTPCILEPSMDRSPNPIPKVEARPKVLFEAMCVHRDCRTPARFICTLSGVHYCTRHRGASGSWEEI